MSNAGQVALGIVGGIVGFYIGGPTGAAYGFQLGLAVGTVVSPTQLPGTFGPRLTDNRTTTSQIGSPVVQVFGTDAVAGTVMWIGDIVEHENTESQGGKGAPEQDVTTYSYTQSIAIGLCAGPMGGILRIWENGKLVYDRRPQQEGESDQYFALRVAASDSYETGVPIGDYVDGGVVAFSSGFTLYLGDEDQLPDPTIELKEGVGNVPGFRGLMYIVFPDRKLRDDQGRRHPNFKFEVFSEGQTQCIETTLASNEVLYPWDDAGQDPRSDVGESYGAYRYRAVSVDEAALHNSLDEAIGDLEDAGFGPLDPDPIGWSVSDSISGDLLPYDGNPSGESVNIYLWFTQRPYNTTLLTPTTECDAGRPDGRWARGSNGGVPHGVYVSALSPDAEATSNFSCAEGIVNFYRDVAVRVTRIPVKPPNPCLIYPSAPIPGYAMFDGGFIECGEWAQEPNYWVLSSYLDNGTDVTQYPLNGARPQADPGDQAYWEAWYNAAVAQGLVIPGGWTYPANYPTLQPFGYARTADFCLSEGFAVSIATIVRAICEKCGLTGNDIDVSDLESRYVEGYQITRVMDGRSAIAPLRSVGFFDVVESGGILKFPVRGKPSVRTLSSDDLGAHPFDIDPQPAVTTKKMQDVELPRQLFVQYRDPARDYETGEQSSPTRLTTDAVNDVYVDVAVAISAEQAARCAEVIWADQWAARWQHTIALDSSQVDIEAADCFLIPVDGRNERVRAVSIEDSAVIMRSIQLVRDDDGSYVSAAIADQPAVPPSTIVIYSATDLIILDLPPLRATDDDVGLYGVARRANADLTWGGAQIYHSMDGGATFQPVVSMVSEASTGTLDASFAAGETTVWDDVTVITVTLASGALESRIDEEVLAGANVIAIGSDERWEILQFANAIQTGPTTWQLSRLLRGRRGTEHLMGTQEAGDFWALMSGPGVARIPLENSYLDEPVIYKAVTLGTSYASGVDQTFTSNGVARLPFSPVMIEAQRDTSEDLLISWIRRDRLGDELPSGSEIAMSDPPETYEVDILSADSPPVIARTLTSNTQSVTYTAAQQGTDFGLIPDQVSVRIYQISTVVGRGTPGESLLEVPS